MYRALESTAAELVWLKSLFTELGVKLDPQPPIIWCDNLGAACLAANPVFHARMKHIEVDTHFFRKKVIAKQLEVRYVPTEDQVANAFQSLQTFLSSSL